MFSKFMQRENPMPLRSGNSKSKSSNSSAVSARSPRDSPSDEQPTKKSKSGLRRLLERTKSVPVPNTSPHQSHRTAISPEPHSTPITECTAQHLPVSSRSASTTPSHNTSSTNNNSLPSPTSALVSPTNRQTASPESLPQRGNPRGPSPSSGNKVSTSGSSNQISSTVSPSASVPSSTGPSPGIHQSQTSSLSSTHNHPCSPLNDVIMEEEYEEPADVSRSITMEIENATRGGTTNGIYFEPCDSKQKKGGERTASSRSQVTPTNYLDKFRGISRSNSIESTTIIAPAPQTTGRSSTASSDSRQTLSESPAVMATSGVECRPKPVSSTPVRFPASSGPVGPSVAIGSASSAFQSVPQGNTTLLHHPASPFAPIQSKPGAPQSSIIVPVQGPVPTRGPAHASADNPPTHEEAWDVKMNRLGLDMSHATVSQWTPPTTQAPGAPPIPPHASAGGTGAPVPRPTPYRVHQSPLLADLTTSMQMDSPSDLAEMDPFQALEEQIQQMSASTPNPCYHGHHDLHTTVGTPGCGSNQLRTRSGLAQPSDSLSGVVSTPNKSRSTEPLSGVLVTFDDSTEQDHSSNCLTGSQHVPFPSTQRQLSGPGISSREMQDEGDLQQASTATLATADTDSLSTDSYDEPWDVRHGRVIRELTSTRLIDPSSVFSSHPHSIFSATSDAPSLIRPSPHHPGTLPHDSPRSPLTSSPPGAPNHPHRTASIRVRRTSGTAPGQTQNQAGPTSPSGVTSSRSHSLETSRVGHHHLQYGQDAEVIPGGDTILEGSRIDEVEIIDDSVLLENQLWYHPGVSRAAAESVLVVHRDGSYLVRRSETNTSDYSLTIKHNHGFLHMKISQNVRGQFILGQYSQPYASIPAMIHHYSRTLLPIRGADSMTLKFPVARSQRNL